MGSRPALHVREWGRGAPVIALHPLGLDSSAFGELAARFAERGLRTIAPDLPGFGQSPAPNRALTPALLARPVIELARELPESPALVGISMGGRVALEAGLSDPAAFRGIVAIAPYLPWLRFRSLMPLARLMSPRLVERVPLELAWPLLRRIARALERAPVLRDDDVAKAAVRVIYYASCPATRASIVSAAREMALEPARGSRGLWNRLPALETPTAFVWGERDRLVPTEFARRIGEVLPGVDQRLLPCLRHALNGPHHRCLAEIVASIVATESGGAARARSGSRRRGRRPPSVAALRREGCRAEREESVERR